MTLRIGIVGTGSMAWTMARAIDATPGLAVGGVVSRTTGRAEALAAAFPGATAFPDLPAMLAASNTGAVYVANATGEHAATAIAVLNARRPLLCEKPLATSGAEVRTIADAAAATGTLAMEAVATPFLPAVAAALAAARDGRLGDLRHLSASFGYRADRASHPGCFEPRGGGVLLDRAVYLVTLARLALGPIEGVEAAVRRDGEGIDTEATLMLRHPGGRTALIAASFDAELPNDLSLAGTEGIAHVPAPLLLAERLTIRAASAPAAPGVATGWRARVKQVPVARRLRALVSGPRPQRLPYGASPYRPELLHFRDLVLAGARESPVLPLSLSAEVLAVLDAARAAS